MPVLPPVLALEALAQAASVLAGRAVRRAARVTMSSPVLIPSAGEAGLRVCALRNGDTVVAVLRCADSSYLVDHARAEFSCSAETEQARRPPSLPVPPRCSRWRPGRRVWSTELSCTGRSASSRAGSAGSRCCPKSRRGRAGRWPAARTTCRGSRPTVSSPGPDSCSAAPASTTPPCRCCRRACRIAGSAQRGAMQFSSPAGPRRGRSRSGRRRGRCALRGQAAGLQLVVPGQPGAPAAETDGRARRAAGASAPAAAPAASSVRRLCRGRDRDRRDVSRGTR